MQERYNQDKQEIRAENKNYMNPLMRKLKQEDMARPKAYMQILDEK